MTARRHPSFRESDLRRAIRSALAEGFLIGAVEIRPDGTLMLRAGEPLDSADESGDPVLDGLLKEASRGKAHGQDREKD
jgi:hypothetical protein